MAKRKVTATLQVETDIKNKGLRLAAYKDDDLLGYLDIGKASLYWYDKHAKNPDGDSTWEELIAWMKKPRKST